MSKVKKRQVSADGTVKFLLELKDQNLVETVLMRHDYGNSVCVTSQAGCSMGCRFCASGLLQKERDLTAEEMLAQVLSAERYLAEEQTVKENGLDEHITHIVVMGTGEPFDNYEEVMRFCDMVSDEKQMRAYARETDTAAKWLSIAPRHITVSTCGLVPKISDFADTKKRYNLAVSLHAPDNEIRNRLMPVNKRYPTEVLLDAAAAYCKKTGRRVTFEYLLLAGVNDSAECAEKLVQLLKKAKPDDKENDWAEDACRFFYVNLIPYNHVQEFGFRGSTKETALRFYDILVKNGIRATLRKERGTDIAAACGQLRSRAGRTDETAQ